VDFENVSFSYVPDTPVLKDITVHVPAGQIVGLVGPSGSGKTTFINLICRFYDPNKGSVKLDDVDVRNISRDDRTRSIGLVSQFSALFRDSIRENIRMGRPEADDDAVAKAASMARVDEFVDSLPEGFDHVLGEGGGGLSGGQRQRVSIARAFLKNAPVLILDEATSALDMRSEAAIQDSLDELAKGHTTFIIAHRFSTLRMAHRILVFDGGKIVADGTHAELYESCMLYRGLYDEQVQQDKEVEA
jgi:subfamily B ATP-binding cassette protein MsbA